MREEAGSTKRFVYFFHCFNFSLFFSVVSFLFSCFFEFFTFGQVTGNARDGRSLHRPTNQRLRVCKVHLATPKVATMSMKFLDRKNNTCGQANPGASGEVQEQVLKKRPESFLNTTTSAFVFRTGNPKRKPIGRRESSRLYHKARGHSTSAKKKNQHS